MNTTSNKQDNKNNNKSATKESGHYKDVFEFGKSEVHKTLKVMEMVDGNVPRYE